MSGAEVVVGLVLGVLPLIISTLEHYEDGLRPFTNYRNFTSKAQRIYDELQIKRTIFRTECQLLLSTVAEREVVSKMLDEPNHPSWNDQEICQRFGHQLGSLGAACSSIVSKIEGKLDEIGQKCGEFSVVILLPKEGITFGDKVWRHRVGKKLKFAFSESGLLGSISELRKLNKTFLTIADQVVRLDSQSSSSLVSSKTDQGANKISREIEKFRIVQQASYQLYEALSRACTLHAQHLALLCLDATCTSSAEGSHHPNIHFKLSITHKHSEADLVSTVQVDQNTTGTIPFSSKQRKTSCNHGQFEKQHDSTIKSNHTKVATLSVCNLSWFEVQTVISKEKMPSPRFLNQNLSVSEFASQTRRLLGVLDETESCRHFVYGPSTSIPTRPKKNSISLTQLIAQESTKGPMGGMPQYRRLNLGKSLALAVLQFHTTPWLGEIWKSDDIMMELGGQETRSPPHLNALITLTKRKTNPIREAKSSSSSFSVTNIAPNGLLFSLGIMLLELAYGAPFESLQQPEDIAASPDSRITDFITARRLADSVGTSLGAAFASIMRKCLLCDFGCGENLEDPELQARLYEDVVCRLEVLEDGFRRLQVGV